MARRMLINAFYPEECRIAVAEDDKLLELEVERADHSQLKGNIYRAPITRIEPSLQAAFLDIGSNRNGFLQINDINRSYFFPKNDEVAEQHRPAIQDVLNARQHLVVQVVKDERAAKGATLTTNLSIPGRYLVLMVGNQRGGVSRKIVDEGQRRRLRQAVQSLVIPAGMGVIVRTAGINKSSVELQRDLDSLLEHWERIAQECVNPKSDQPVILYEEANLAIRTIRDYLTTDIDEILIDNRAIYDQACEFVKRIVPGFESKIVYYDKPQPLFGSFHLDSQIEETNLSEVTLPSGGSIVINSTEAVVAIDVNSGRATSQADVEHTAFQTNKEAAQAIAKQLRLRDLGGLVVIDFIDMIDRKHKQVVEKNLKDSIKGDKAKIEIGRISKFGLLEMSRQRLKSSLASQSNITCPQCEGRGKVLTPESDALEVLRKLQSSAFAGGVDEIRVHMAPSSALLLLNNQRSQLSDFEARSNTRIIIFADGRKRTGKYELELHTARAETSSSESEIKAPSNQDRDGGPDSDRGSRRRSGQGRNNSGRSGSGKNRSGGRRRSNNRGDRRKKPPRSKNSGASSAPQDSKPKRNEEKSSGGNESEGGGRKEPPAQAS